MKIKVWISVTDSDDGSHNARLYPTEAHLRTELQLDQDDFSPKYDVPVEIFNRVIDVNEYLMVEA